MQQIDKKVDKDATYNTTNLRIISIKQPDNTYSIMRGKISNQNYFVQNLNYLESSNKTKKAVKYDAPQLLDINSCLDGAGNGYIHYAIGNHSGVNMSSRGFYWDAGSFYLPVGPYIDRSIFLKIDSSFSFYRSSDNSLYTSGFMKKEWSIIKSGTSAPQFNTVLDISSASASTIGLTLICIQGDNIGFPAEYLHFGANCDYYGMSGSIFFDVTLLITQY
jgi:hypothetical protein